MKSLREIIESAGIDIHDILEDRISLEGYNLNEAFEPGEEFKFSNGKTKKLTKDESKVLKNMYNDLNTSSKAEMVKTAKSDLQELDDLIAFARRL